MKHRNIHSLFKIIASVFAAGLFIAASQARAENEFRLKEGAKARTCLECHETIQKTLESRYIHTPVKLGECSGCHNPHTSDHGKLLDDDINSLCYNCHKKVVPEGARSVHQVVVEGNCVSCHDSHASDNEFVLIRKGNDLCFECHQDMADKLRTIEFPHEPVEKKKGCVTCHDPHASAGFAFILKDEAPTLCTNCHETGKKDFARDHRDYPVAGSRCTSCHNSHGSGRKGIIYDGVHEPVALKQCEKCHEGPGSPTPLKTVTQGVDLCRDCHKEMVDATFSKIRVHGPLLDKRGCLNCHNAHAASRKNLVSGSIRAVCGECHKDTVELQNISINNPDNKNLCKPVKEGDCIDCHTPHSSDGILLIAEESISFGTCNKCHEWQSHSTHPIGEKVIDPRNSNLIVDCLSCHRACGTANKRAMMPFDNTYILCIQCHESYRR